MSSPSPPAPGDDGSAGPAPPGEEAGFAAFQARAEAANLNPQTLLATDYLNHFNEIVMLIEMVGDMPEILEDCREWAPKDYCAHFADSAFKDKELAIAAYAHVPARFKTPFEETISHLNHLVAQAIERLDEALAAGDPEITQVRAHAASRAIQKGMDVASSIIHGAERAMRQDEIDDLLQI